VNYIAKNQEFEVENLFKLVGNRQRPYPASYLRRLTVSKGAESLREPLHQQEDNAADDTSPEQSADSQNQESGYTATCFIWFMKMFKRLFAHRIPPENLCVPNRLLKCKPNLTSVSLALRLLRCECRGRRFGIGLSKCSLNCSHRTCRTVNTGDDDRLAARLLASGNAPSVCDNRFKFSIKEFLFGHPNKGSQFFT
jgi:hypothetical protein